MTKRAQDLRLLLLTDRRAAPRGGLLRAIGAALEGGATAIMLREKDLPTRELYEMAVDLREIARRSQVLLIVNDRADIAMAAGADGVHLGWLSMPIEKVRAIIGCDRLIGVSTHSIEEALQAEKEGADYVTFGPIYPTPSKVGLVEAQGVKKISELRAAGVRIPLICVGGINATNAGPVYAAGADGVAMIRGLLAAADPAAEAKQILAQYPS